MKQYDKLNKFVNVSSYTISKLEALLYLMPEVSSTSLKQIARVQRCSLDFYILANDAVNVIDIFNLLSPFPHKSSASPFFITVITLHIKCISLRITVYISKLQSEDSA